MRPGRVARRRGSRDFRRPIRGGCHWGDGDPVVFASLDHRLISATPPASESASAANGITESYRQEIMRHNRALACTGRLAVNEQRDNLRA